VALPAPQPPHAAAAARLLLTASLPAVPQWIDISYSPGSQQQTHRSRVMRASGTNGRTDDGRRTVP